MTGNFDTALSDANACISLRCDSYKGYGRKGAAYYAMCKYDRAIEVYNKGLSFCPDKKHLTIGVQAARRAMARKSKASNAVRKAEIVTHATRRKSLQSSSTVSDFVLHKREELLLKKAQIQCQLDLIDDLAAMESESKLDLLFTLIDRDVSGTIDADELALALRKRNKDLRFQESLDHAMQMVASHDLNGDAKLDIDEFRSCIYEMITELNVSVGEFAEFLVFQINSYNDTCDAEWNEKGKKELEEHEEFKHILTHTRMEELFILFDRDGSGELSFKEVAIGLYQITQNVEQSTKAAMDLLLMMDKNDTRTLDYVQFSRLIVAIVATANCSFEAIADDLVSQTCHLVRDRILRLLSYRSFDSFLRSYLCRKMTVSHQNICRH
jgi:Ca2+-binding EF-hand superfamily protein